jgi:hypothetical protein
MLARQAVPAGVFASSVAAAVTDSIDRQAAWPGRVVKMEPSAVAPNEGARVEGYLWLRGGRNVGGASRPWSIEIARS